MKTKIGSLEFEGTPQEIVDFIYYYNLYNSQVSTGDESSMFSKASIRKPSDELSNPREDSCKPETLPDTHTKDYGHKDLIKENSKRIGGKDGKRI